MLILRLGFAGLFLLTLPTGVHLATGALVFLLVLLAGMAVESVA
jgi:hypothetical protein